MNVLPPREHFAEALPSVRLARVETFADFAAAEPSWRALDRQFATPYQGYDFLRIWQRHVGRAAGVTPCIVVGFDAAGAPLFVWPFGRRRLAGCRVLEFLGGCHANFNMGLWRPGIAAAFEPADLSAMLARLAEHADLLNLHNQPLSWGGTTNPFALLPHQPSASSGFSGALIGDFEALLRAHTDSATRRKMRKKQRALEALGSVRFERAQGPERIRQTLDAFFKQKHARMRALGIADVFAKANVRCFIEAAASEATVGGVPPIELYALSVDDMVVATMGGMIGYGRFCGMFNSIASGRYSVHSPGEQLILRLVRLCCERGLTAFDLGIGEARYKDLFCGDAEPLFDSILPLTAKGRPLAAALRVGAAAKHAIKQHPPLWATVRAWRALRARFSANG
jgi:CelD/BcsL family acetyltransferase involved in cellulose biosynthesis